MAEQSYSQSIPPPYFADDEIDLRVYINIVLRYWRLIVAIALLTAIGAGVGSIFQSMSQVPQYEAVALVATDKEGLAISETVLLQLQSSLAADLSLNELRQMLSVETIDNTPPIIQLKVRSDDPERAAEIANWWANLFVMATNQAKTIQQNELAKLAIVTEQAKITEGRQLAELRSLLGEYAPNEREAAEDALSLLERNNNNVLLQAQLNSLTAVYSDLLSQQHDITVITRDIEGFQALLASQSADAPATLADELTAILLQFKIFNDDSKPENGPNDLMLQFSSAESLSHKTAGELLTWLDELQLTIQEKSNKIKESLTQLETDIADTNTVLQVEKARMSLEFSSERVEIVSKATVPQNEVPVNSPTLTNIALATVVGIIIGLGIAFFIEYWRQDPNATEEGSEG